MTLKKFEELKCWQKARTLTRRIYTYIKTDAFKRDLKLCDQICGASISVMNNICEGFDSKSNREFIRFLVYARRSCSEVQNCLYIASDQAYITTDQFHHAYNQCAQIRKMIDGLIHHLNNSQPPKNESRPAKQVNRPTAQLTNRPTG